MKRYWPIVLLGFILVFVVGVSAYTDTPNQEKQASANNGTPLSGLTEAQTKQPGENGQNAKSSPFITRFFRWPDGVTAIFVLLTLFFIAWQTFLTREAINSSDLSGRAELRAYIGITINSGSYQDREKEIRFEGAPLMTNTGKTPAHNVRYRTNAAILKDPVPASYVFPQGQNEIGEYVLGMNLPMVIHTVMEDYVDQNDVESIMKGGDGRALYCWGKVTYEDTFGESHYTEFCHRLYFYQLVDNPTWKVNGNYMAGRNKAT